jgi:hypothetical protein
MPIGIILRQVKVLEQRASCARIVILEKETMSRPTAQLPNQPAACHDTCKTEFNSCDVDLPEKWQV